MPSGFPSLQQNKVMATSGFIQSIRLEKLGEIRFCLLKSRKQNYWRIIVQRFILPSGEDGYVYITFYLILNYDTKDYTLRLVRWGSEDS